MENTELTYELDNLINRLEEIYLGESDTMNFAKALMTLALEIQEIKKIIKPKT